ncbi:MAG: hypothetical protein C0503_03360 [Gemmatimonas sp.]|nr:hypothetical protein [Gemmatimonas sp.]
MDGWITAACLALGVGLYATSLRNGFAFDDVPIIANNPIVRELEGLLKYFSTSYWGPSTSVDSAYRPMTVRLFAVQWMLGNGSPWTFHLVATVLYGICCALAYGVARTMLAPLGAAVGALAFAVTPLHVEAVANVVGQAELWVFAWLAIAFLLYVEARLEPTLRPLRAMAIVGAYGIALNFKEHAVVLPAMVLGFELIFGLGWKRLWRAEGTGTRTIVLGMGLIAAAFVAVRLQVSTGDSAQWDLRDFGFVERSIVMLRLMPTILRLLLWPAHLAADYSPQFVSATPNFDADFVIGAAMVVVLTTAAVLARRRAPAITFGLLWAAVAWLPVSNLLFKSGVLVAERTLFLSSFGVALAVGACAAPLLRALAPVRVMRVTVTALAGCALLLGAARTLQRIPAWEDNAAVFAQMTVDTPSNARAWAALAEYYNMVAREAPADSMYRKALELDPGHRLIELNYGLFLQGLWRCDEAIPIFRRFLIEMPNATSAHLGLVSCLLATSQYSRARLAILDGQAQDINYGLFRRLRRSTDSLLVVTDSVDARNRWAREGRPFDRTNRRFLITMARGRVWNAAQRRRLQEMQAAGGSSSAATSSGIP